MLWGACAAAQAGLETGGATAPRRRVHPRPVRRSGLRPAAPQSRPLPRRHRVVRRADVLPPRHVRILKTQRRHASANGIRAGVEAIVRIQGDRGEWPWLISVRGGVPLDTYPVFAVHQDSMSMLFLLPALESELNVREAIGKSFAWIRGRNELSTPMIERGPFVAYRSIERTEGMPRARRYLRATIGSVTGAKGNRRTDGAFDSTGNVAHTTSVGSFTCGLRRAAMPRRRRMQRFRPSAAAASLRSCAESAVSYSLVPALDGP